jgi:glutaryl-CoA dehydrogenase
MRIDFYGLDTLLAADELRIVDRVREFMRTEVAPIINDAWTRARFPFEILPAYAAPGISTSRIPVRAHCSKEWS